MGIGRNEADEISLFGRTVPAKGLQPRIVLGLLLAGSFVGIWLARIGHPPLVRIISWSIIVTNGLLVGGLYWRLVLFDSAAFDDANNSWYVRNRWNQLETVSAWVFALAGLASLSLGVVNAPFQIGEVALGIGFVCVPLLWLGLRRGAVDIPSSQKRTVRSALFVFALVSLAGFAWIETRTGPVDWLVRLTHVGMFSLWIGGAAWHNFVVLSTMRSRPEAAKTLKSQARRFRRHLPVVITLIFVTGVYQTVELVGLSVSTLLSSPVGHLIGFKLLLVVVLTSLVIAHLKKAT